MKKVIRLTESDLNRIVKQVISEATVSDIYFRRRGVNVLDVLSEIVEGMNVCKYVKLKTYFNHVMNGFIIKMYLNNEFIKDELGEHESDLELEIIKYIIDNHIDFLMYYYKLKCGGYPKY